MARYNNLTSPDLSKPKKLYLEKHETLTVEKAQCWMLELLQSFLEVVWIFLVLICRLSWRSVFSRFFSKCSWHWLALKKSRTSNIQFFSFTTTTDRFPHNEQKIRWEVFWKACIWVQAILLHVHTHLFPANWISCQGQLPAQSHLQGTVIIIAPYSHLLPCWLH